MDERPGIIDAEHFALFLDVDGTLLDIQPHPDAVVADEGLRDLLERLSGLFGGAVALISGRTVAALDRIFSPLRIASAGAHGAELRIAGTAVSSAVPHELPAHVDAALRDFAARHEGLLLERKPAGASLHYRRAPALENACRQLVQSLMDDLAADFRIIDGKMVLELAPVGATKGEAIRALMHEAPFAGRRPVFVGDDVTDEDGFRTVNALGGVSVRVGDLAGSAAQFRLDDIRAVRDWLQEIAADGSEPEQGETAIAQS